MEEAEVAGKKAIELAKNESDPWALHALAHVYYNTLRFRDGIELLGPEKENWKDCNSFMYTHNWWHYSLVGNTKADLLTRPSSFWTVTYLSIPLYLFLTSTYGLLTKHVAKPRLMPPLS